MQNAVAQSNAVWPKPLTWFLGFFSLIIVVGQYAEPIWSNDLWWHMALGRHILATGQLIIDHSIFTWTEATSYHTYNAWLSEIILYLIYVNTGAVGLVALRHLFFSGFFAFAVYFAIKRNIISNPLVWLIITFGNVLSFLATLIQPELFSFAFMYIVVGLYFTIRATGERAWKLCYLFPVIMVLWVNSHGAFTVSAFFFASVIIGELLNIKFASPHALPITLRTHLFIALGLCIVAVSVNPYGYHLPLSLLEYAVTFKTELSKLSTTISGWDPTSRYNAPPFYALDNLIVAMIIYVFLIWQSLKNKRVDWVTILVFPVYSFLFVTMLRTTHFLAPVFVFSSLDLLAQQENSWAWPSFKPTKLIITLFSVALVGLIGYRAICAVACNTYHGSLWDGPIIDSNHPLEEAEYISKLPHVKNIGNGYGSGGYLMYRLWPNMLSMVDPRYFPFTAWIQRLLDFEQANNVQEFMRDHKPDIWLINHEKPYLMDWFANSKLWIPLFIGRAGVVFAPASATRSVLPQISPNIAKTDSILTLIGVFHTALVLKHWALAERIRDRTNVLAQNRSYCGPYVTFNDDVQRAFTGMRAFNNGDYATTAAQLSKKTGFLDLTNIAIMAHALLAQRAWNKNDYMTARAMAIGALSLEPKNVASAYNAAITDWQYRRSMAPKQITVSDDITWQFLVAILLQHKGKIPQTQKFIINILTAMQNDTLRNKPPLLVPPMIP